MGDIRRRSIIFSLITAKILCGGVVLEVRTTEMEKHLFRNGTDAFAFPGWNAYQGDPNKQGRVSVVFTNFTMRAV